MRKPVSRSKNVKNGRLGDVIRARRLALEITLRDLASACLKPDGGSLSQQYIYDIENSSRAPSLETVEKIANALGLEPDYLVVLAGHTPRSITMYFEEIAEAAPAAARAFVKALEERFTDWDSFQPSTRVRALHGVSR